MIHLHHLAVFLLSVGTPILSSATEAPLVQETREVLSFDQSHAKWSAVLGRALQGSDIDYAVLKKDRAGLDAYLKVLEGVKSEDFAEWSRKQRYAFWVNAYNAYTIRLVVDHYPLKSIKDIGDEKLGTWDRAFIPLKPLFLKAKGDKLSLNDIEHEILRKRYADARVHAAVNCASKGCPPLVGKAFTAKGLDAQLDMAVQTWLADETRNRFDARKRTAEISEIFNWFAEDFVRDGKSVSGWLARFAPEEERGWLVKEKVTLRYRDYDWALNDVPMAAEKE
ncbi:MAG: hypothetical protein ACI8X5_002809 [Planctomycetota bacterium]|jgi:hypothetical protein